MTLNIIVNLIVPEAKRVVYTTVSSSIHQVARPQGIGVDI